MNDWSGLITANKSTTCCPECTFKIFQANKGGFPAISAGFPINVYKLDVTPSVTLRATPNTGQIGCRCSDIRLTPSEKI